MKIRPLHDWVVVRPGKAQEKTAGGIVIPEVAKERPQEGEVLSVGEGRYEKDKDERGKSKGEEKKFIKTVLKPGDRIMYEKYSARKLEIEGEELVMVREEDVLGRLE
jgi:chaperonin GroES